jgi:peptidoglycan/xylan/chitin deacetylase (PgdA/CDA1 family)
MMQSCKTVMYHYVRPINDSIFPKIKGLELEDFKKQINFLVKNYSFLNINQILKKIYENKDIPTNSIILTFDDGFKDHYDYVFPVLKKLKIQGVFFPPGEPIDKKIVLDVHKIHHILANCNNHKELVEIILKNIKEAKKKFDLENPSDYYKRLAISNRFDDGDIIFIKRILQKELPEKLRNEITDELFLKYVTGDEKEFSSKLYLSHEEIKEMVENGMEFGSHGYSHYWLSNLNESKLDIELKKSEDFLRKFSKNSENWTFCYPYGDYNQKVISKIKNIGFKAGFTTKFSDTELIKEKRFELNRFDTNDFKKPS